MSMLITILVVVALIAFASTDTKWVGLICVALLIYLQPVLTLTALALLGGAFFYNNR